MWHNSATTLERVQTPRGELVLRSAEGRYEIIGNGVFLMDTSDGTSERLLVDAAIARCGTPSPRVLIGGLGVGFSLCSAVAHAHLGAIDVVEIEPAVVAWHERYLTEITALAMRDPRVRILEADIIDWLRLPRPDADPAYDVICLDTDNGPNWLVFDSNADVYSSRGLDLAYRRLAAGGVLAVWSASRQVEYEDRVRARFSDLEVLEIPRDRGAPDIVYIARR